MILIVIFCHGNEGEKGGRGLRGITTRKNFFYIEEDINLKLCMYTDFDMLSTNLKRYFWCGFSFPWKP